MQHAVIVVVAALMAGSASSLVAQSLGEVAKKEEARRKGVTRPGKVYTNESLGGPGDTAPAPSAAAAVPVPAAQPTPTPGAPDEERKDENYWRGRITQAREALDRAKTFQEALQSRINALTADFTARDDPAQRAVLSNNRQKAIAELDRVTKEIADYEQAIRDIEEEARKAGVPPGWLR
ncbi:MAG: hypothetical protein ACRD26_12950 [Vicinamibacterales bacterium]